MVGLKVRFTDEVVFIHTFDITGFCKLCTECDKEIKTYREIWKCNWIKRKDI